MQVYGKEIDFKMTRLEDAAKLELAMQNMAEKEKEIKAEVVGKKQLSAVLMLSIAMFSSFFKDLTGQDVLAGCTDFTEAKDAYLDFIKAIDEQKKEIQQFSLDGIL